jgi:hypothetical protein
MELRMETVNAIQSFTGLTLTGGAALTAVWGAFLAFVVWRRTRSAHPILAKLWRLFDGKRECADKDMSNLLAERSALMQFRFTTGIPARTLPHAFEIAAWAKEHQQEFDDIAACGYYFDLERPSLKSDEQLPRPFTAGLLLVVTALLAASFTLTGTAASINKAFLRMKESGQWLTLSADSAKPFSGHPGFVRADCSKDPAQVYATAGFSEKDVGLICDMLKQDTVATFVKDTVWTQRITLGVLTFVLAAFALEAFRSLKSMAAAHDMRRRLRTRAQRKSAASIREKAEDTNDAP